MSVSTAHLRAAMGRQAEELRAHNHALLNGVDSVAEIRERLALGIYRPQSYVTISERPAPPPMQRIKGSRIAPHAPPVAREAARTAVIARDGFGGGGRQGRLNQNAIA